MLAGSLASSKRYLLRGIPACRTVWAALLCLVVSAGTAHTQSSAPQPPQIPADEDRRGCTEVVLVEGEATLCPNDNDNNPDDDDENCTAITKVCDIVAICPDERERNRSRIERVGYYSDGKNREEYTLLSDPDPDISPQFGAGNLKIICFFRNPANSAAAAGAAAAAVTVIAGPTSQ